MYYGNAKQHGPGKIILHISDLRVMGQENVPLSAGDELMDLISLAGATHVMFTGLHMPQRSVSVDHPKFASYVRRQFAAPRQPRCDEPGCRKAAQAGDIFCAEHRRLEDERTTGWDNDDLLDIIDS